MRLTSKAIEAVKSSVRCRNLLAVALDCSVWSIQRYLDKRNSDELTKAAALRVIREETGLTDSEILEESEAIQQD